MEALIRDALDGRFVGQRVTILREMSRGEKESMFGRDLWGNRFHWIKGTVLGGDLVTWKAAEELEFLP
jgi:hypothetical protein